MPTTNPIVTTKMTLCIALIVIASESAAYSQGDSSFVPLGISDAVGRALEFESPANGAGTLTSFQPNIAAATERLNPPPFTSDSQAEPTLKSNLDGTYAVERTSSPTRSSRTMPMTPFDPSRVYHCIGGNCEAKASREGGANGAIPLQAFSQRNKAAARTSHLPEYRVRVDDKLELVFRTTHSASPTANSSQVIPLGLTEDVSDMEAGDENWQSGEFESLDEHRSSAEESPKISVHSRRASVTASGTIQLPAVGSVHAHGLTLTELKREIEAAYNRVGGTLEVTPILEQRSPRAAFVVGAVAKPGRFALAGPTTLPQAIAMAGNWREGANLRQVILFRRDKNWNLLAARVDLQSLEDEEAAGPTSELWLRDADIVLVPSGPIHVIEEAIDLVFASGVHSVYPVIFTDGLTQL